MTSRPPRPVAGGPPLPFDRGVERFPHVHENVHTAASATGCTDSGLVVAQVRHLDRRLHVERLRKHEVYAVLAGCFIQSTPPLHHKNEAVR
ncbi:MAG: hypothetical protein OXL97_07765 [Chloroflexota bacterium]|nr:hypothetical protein [Chloroflexota bacterium]MDE2883797.1 hypothetical protein [Chloroflexota bacterium]